MPPALCNIMIFDGITRVYARIPTVAWGLIPILHLASFNRLPLR